VSANERERCEWADEKKNEKREKTVTTKKRLAS
jgi:hypothetical protein